MSLYLRSILWDLGVPQDATTILYEDKNGATAMANAGKLMPCSWHIDVKYYAIQEWVERDLLVLCRIQPITSPNPFPAFSSTITKISTGPCTSYILA
ncbi:hypothetical protein ACHAW6_011905 [Cyclotella cf. meneghiniana]